MTSPSIPRPAPRTLGDTTRLVSSKGMEVCMPSIEWLKKHAKQLLSELRKTHPDAQLSDAQLQVARENGFPSWRALKAHFDTLTVDGRLVEAARTGDVDALREVLAQYPEKVQARS